MSCFKIKHLVQVAVLILVAIIAVNLFLVETEKKDHGKGWVKRRHHKRFPPIRPPRPPQPRYPRNLEQCGIGLTEFGPCQTEIVNTARSANSRITVTVTESCFNGTSGNFTVRTRGTFDIRGNGGSVKITATENSGCLLNSFIVRNVGSYCYARQFSDTVRGRNFCAGFVNQPNQAVPIRSSLYYIDARGAGCIFTQ